jgi:hypothetical protein
MAERSDTFVIEIPTTLLERSMLLTEGMEVELDTKIVGFHRSKRTAVFKTNGRYRSQPAISLLELEPTRCRAEAADVAA